MTGSIVSLASDGQHRFAKQPKDSLRFVAGLGIDGDAHAGKYVQHRSRVKRSPQAPNLRQVHLIHCELLKELAKRGFAVRAGQLGENVTTMGIDLLRLSSGTRLRLGAEVLVEITGLRNPCRQIDENVGPGAMAAVLDRSPEGELLRKAGVMGIVVEGGWTHLGEPITVDWQPGNFVPLQPV